jgi:hypothetical protein
MMVKFRFETMDAIQELRSQLRTYQQTAAALQTESGKGGSYRWKQPFKVTACLDFMKGNCSYGDTNCRFIHDEVKKAEFTEASKEEQDAIELSLTGGKKRWNQSSWQNKGPKDYSEPEVPNTKDWGRGSWETPKAVICAGTLGKDGTTRCAHVACEKWPCYKSADTKTNKQWYCGDCWCPFFKISQARPSTWAQTPESERKGECLGPSIIQVDTGLIDPTEDYLAYLGRTNQFHGAVSKYDYDTDRYDRGWGTLHPGRRGVSYGEDALISNGDLVWEPEVLDPVPAQAETAPATTDHEDLNRAGYPAVKTPNLTIPTTPAIKPSWLHQGEFGEEVYCAYQGAIIGRPVTKTRKTRDLIKPDLAPGSRVFNVAGTVGIYHGVDAEDATEAWAPSHEKANNKCLRKAGHDNRLGHLQLRKGVGLSGPHPQMRRLAWVEWNYSMHTIEGLMKLVQVHHASRFHDLAEDEACERHPRKEPGSRFMSFLLELGMCVPSLDGDRYHAGHPGAKEADDSDPNSGTIWAPDDRALLSLYETWWIDGGFNAEGLGHVWDMAFMNKKLSEEEEEAVQRRTREQSVVAR